MAKAMYAALLLVLLASLGMGLFLLLARPKPGGVLIVVPTATAQPALKVYISGAVAAPGVYTVQPGSRLEDVVSVAGGAVENADLSRVNLAQRIRDQDHFHIPVVGEPSTTVQDSGKQRIDINTASLEELAGLPRIKLGAGLAQAIIDYRNEHGPFRRVDELMKVRGIGPSIYETIRELVAVGEVR